MTRYNEKSHPSDDKHPEVRGDIEVAIEEVVRRTVSSIYDLADGGKRVFIPEGMTAHDLPAINPVLPDFVTQTEVLVMPDSFKAYVSAFKSSTAIVRAFAAIEEDREKRIAARPPHFVAVLDYHGRAREGERDAAVAGRCQHVVQLNLPWSPEYEKWRPVLMGGFLPQKQFVEFCENLVQTIALPAFGDLYDALNAVEIDRVTKFKSARNDRNGNIQFALDEQDGETIREGRYTLPDRVQLVVSIFQGGLAQQLDTKLRYWLDGGKLFLGLHVPAMDAIEREAFMGVGEDIASATGTPVFYAA